jgi:uncharacterized membrane protein YdjX (TVP38/TMEM64 family)
MSIIKIWNDYVTAAKLGVAPMIISITLVVSEYLKGETIPIWVIALVAPMPFLTLGILSIDIVRKKKKKLNN